MLMPSEFRLINELPPRPVVVDGGAGWGEWTAAVLAVRPHAQCILFEPHPAHLGVLRERFAGVRNVAILDCALSDRYGEREFHIDPVVGSEMPAYGSSLHRMPQHHAAVRVTTESYNWWMKYRDRVDLLKLDVEGAELEAIRGLVPRHYEAGAAPLPAIIQFEYSAQTWGEAGAELGEAVGRLTTLGYNFDAIPEKDCGYANVVARLRGLKDTE